MLFIFKNSQSLRSSRPSSVSSIGSIRKKLSYTKLKKKRKARYSSGHCILNCVNTVYKEITGKYSIGYRARTVNLNEGEIYIARGVAIVLRSRFKSRRPLRNDRSPTSARVANKSFTERNNRRWVLRIFLFSPGTCSPRYLIFFVLEGATEPARVEPSAERSKKLRGEVNFAKSSR